MDHREKLLQIVQDKGPLLPAQINRNLNTNVLFASAMLSEMVDAKKLKLSHMKIGGSPLYYCAGQESQLESFAEKLDAPYLNAFNLLKDNKIIRDRDQQPSVRVSLREIKDFAVPLEVTANGATDLFWKYYLVEDNEAKDLIKSYIQPKPKPSAQKQSNKDVGKDQSRRKEVQAKISSVEKVNLPEPSHGGADQRVAELAASETTAHSNVVQSHIPQDVAEEFEYSPAFSFSTSIDTDEPVKIEKKKEDPAIEKQRALAFPEGDPFFDRVKSFFDENEMEIKDFELIRKGTDFDFIITVPSKIGNLNYCCKAKSKKKISEFDLHSAFVHGHVNKLPVFMLSDGELTSKAKNIMNKEFKSMIFRQIK